MKQKTLRVVKSVMAPANPISPETSVEEASKIIIRQGVNHLPVVRDDKILIGIITSWDVAKAVATGKLGKVEEIMTKKVVTVLSDDPIQVAARKMEKHDISALPVTDTKKHLIGLITSEDLSRLISGG
jgi:CBS domain-containing protein